MQNDLKTKRAELSSVCEFLTPKDRKFASDLIQFFDTNHRWSEKQLYWVDTLTQRGRDSQHSNQQQPLPLPPVDGKEQQAFQSSVGQALANKMDQDLLPPVPVQNLQRITGLFQKARAQGLKYPKIRLEAEDSTKVILRFSAATKWHPDEILVTNHLPYNEGRLYFGRINLEGVFTKTRETTPAILALINKLAEDPVGLAKLYGLKTSTCCFCSRPLENSESVAVGYGPICAEKFGLPWGHTSQSSYTCLTLEKNDAQPHPAN